MRVIGFWLCVLLVTSCVECKASCKVCQKPDFHPGMYFTCDSSWTYLSDGCSAQKIGSNTLKTHSFGSFVYQQVSSKTADIWFRTSVTSVKKLGRFDVGTIAAASYDTLVTLTSKNATVFRWNGDQLVKEATLKPPPDFVQQIGSAMLSNDLLVIASNGRPTQSPVGMTLMAYYRENAQWKLIWRFDQPSSCCSYTQRQGNNWYSHTECMTIKVTSIAGDMVTGFSTSGCPRVQGSVTLFKVTMPAANDIVRVVQPFLAHMYSSSPTNRCSMQSHLYPFASSGSIWTYNASYGAGAHCPGNWSTGYCFINSYGNKQCASDTVFCYEPPCEPTIKARAEVQSIRAFVKSYSVYSLSDYFNFSVYASLLLRLDPIVPSWLKWFSPAHQLSIAPVSGSQGLHNFTVFGTYDGVIVHDSFVLVIDIPNRAPVVENYISDIVTKPGQLFQEAINSNTFTDPDGDVLDYALGSGDSSALPEWISFDKQARIISGVVPLQQIRSISLLVSACDDFGGCISASLSLIVDSECATLSCAHGALKNCSCECDGGWEGRFCSDCAYSGGVCQHGGRENAACTGCECAPGFFWLSPSNCSVCDPAACSHGVPNSECTRCICANENWAGIRCDTCMLSCTDRGTPNSACEGCVCDDPWQGTRCDRCPLNCTHSSTPDPYCSRCVCQGYWSGPLCDSCSLECNHGRPDDSCSTCECNPGWTGTRCDVCDRHCGRYGKPDQTCMQCVCEHPWTGEQCDQCPLSCHHDAVPDPACENCLCSSYWNGQLCDSCGLSCRNGGSVTANCTACECVGFWKGTFCQQCDISCTNLGIPDLSSCTCTCLNQWKGRLCSQCSLNCHNNGTRSDDCRYCRCTNAWTSASNCSLCGLECENGGYANTECSQCEGCDSNFGGIECDRCMLNCLNDGQGNFNCTACECPGYWTGSRCEKCTLSCANGGTLSDGCAECECQSGWTGDDCSLPDSLYLCSREVQVESGTVCIACQPAAYLTDYVCMPCFSAAGWVFAAYVLVFIAALPTLVKFMESPFFSHLKITVYFYQVCTLFKPASMYWPSSLRSILISISFVNFRLPSLQCIAPNWPQYSPWLILMLFPAASCLIVAGLFVVARTNPVQIAYSRIYALLLKRPISQPSRDLPYTVLRWFLTLMSFLYIPLTDRALCMFMVIQSDTAAEHYVSAYPTVVAGSAEHILLCCIAVLALLLYTVAFPCTLVWILVKHRHNLSHESVVAKFGFLYAKFKPNRFWFELFVMGNKLAIALVSFILTDRNFVVSLVAVLFVQVCTEIAFLWLRPFNTTRNNITLGFIYGLSAIFLGFAASSQAPLQSVFATALVQYCMIAFLICGATILLVNWIIDLTVMLWRWFHKRKATTHELHNLLRSTDTDDELNVE